MIEVLVSIVVLSVGLLGVAALQMSGLRVGQSSFYRAQAAQFATDMADRMRANFGDAPNYGLALTAATPTCNPSGPPADRIRKCDQAEWRALLSNLPGGTGAIEVNTASNLVTITVQWDDSRGGGDAVSTFALVTRLWGS